MVRLWEEAEARAGAGRQSGALTVQSLGVLSESGALTIQRPSLLQSTWWRRLGSKGAWVKGKHHAPNLHCRLDQVHWLCESVCWRSLGHPGAWGAGRVTQGRPCQDLQGGSCSEPHLPLQGDSSPITVLQWPHLCFLDLLLVRWVMSPWICSSVSTTLLTGKQSSLSLVLESQVLTECSGDQWAHGPWNLNPGITTIHTHLFSGQAMYSVKTEGAWPESNQSPGGFWARSIRSSCTLQSDCTGCVCSAKDEIRTPKCRSLAGKFPYIFHLKRKSNTLPLT